MKKSIVSIFVFFLLCGSFSSCKVRNFEDKVTSEVDSKYEHPEIPWWAKPRKFRGMSLNSTGTAALPAAGILAIVIAQVANFTILDLEASPKRFAQQVLPPQEYAKIESQLTGDVFNDPLKIAKVVPRDVILSWDISKVGRSFWKYGNKKTSGEDPVGDNIHESLIALDLDTDSKEYQRGAAYLIRTQAISNNLEDKRAVRDISLAGLTLALGSPVLSLAIGNTLDGARRKLRNEGSLETTALTDYPQGTKVEQVAAKVNKSFFLKSFQWPSGVESNIDAVFVISKRLPLKPLSLEWYPKSVEYFVTLNLEGVVLKGQLFHKSGIKMADYSRDYATFKRTFEVVTAKVSGSNLDDKVDETDVTDPLNFLVAHVLASSFFLEKRL